MRLGRSVLGLIAGLMIAGCVPSGDFSPMYHSSSDDDGPSIGNTSGGIKAALKDGCRKRYGDNDRKYRECINGDRHSEDALIEGCYARYNGNKDKLRDCLRAAR